jgi:phosphate starvation-inducible PhoH-like protein
VFSNGDLHSFLRVVTEDSEVSLRQLVLSGKQRSFGKKVLAPRSVNQRRYVEAIERNDMVFGIGPAGTGKTYLAVAMAVAAFLSKKVSRIVLTRPAVEAGERLGFLPGTLQEKVDPTCARSTMPCLKCWKPSGWKSCWSAIRLRWLPWRSCADAP